MNEKSKLKLAQLRQYQSLSLNGVERLSEIRIREALDRFENQAYVAFSGGLNSTILLDMVWKINPNIPAVFVDTGLEYPEIREFVKTYGDRVTWIKPEMSFAEVIKKYGFPVASKQVSDYVHRVRHTKSDQVRRRHLKGENADGSPSRMSQLAIKWQPLINAPFECSHRCCHIMKVKPFHQYFKKERRYPLIGTMAGESRSRLIDYMKSGCNAFDKKDPQSRPMMFWTHQHCLEYLRKYDLPICSVYGEQEFRDGEWVLTGEQRTGCMFCMFGVQFDEVNRFQRMYYTHPKQWNYCINTLGCGAVMDFIGVKYKPEGEQMAHTTVTKPPSPADQSRLKGISKAIEVVTKGKVPYVESNDRCQICDRPCVGKHCDYHKELIRNGDI